MTSDPFKEFREVASVTLADFAQQMAAFRKAFGLPSGYVGRRCGWYPERPRRHVRKDRR